jgi:hypothetical protein
MATETIVFPAEIYKVQTLVDNGVRITLDLPETCIMQMAQLAECKRAGIVLEFTARALDKINIRETNAKPKLEARNKRKSTWTTAETTGIN